MKLQCEIETVFALTQTDGASCKNKRTRASLTVGKKHSGKMEEIFLVVSTMKNVSGMTYKIKGNVTKLFTRFIKNGQVTIRFKEPAHDLSISQADPIKLRQFLALLRLTPPTDNDIPESEAVPLTSNVKPKMKDLEKPQTKLVVRRRGDYPLSGFPSSLEVFEAVDVSLNRIDKRLLILSHLRYLNLSDNSIKVIPEEISSLGLVELKLAGNQITEYPVGVCYGLLTNTLCTLDLSRNNLSHLPFQFQHYKSLVTLRLDCNKIQLLPRSFGKLSNLRFLFASSNQLAVLPHSFSNLTLESLDLFNNPFKASGLIKRCKDLSLPTLVELAGRTIKKHKLPYSPCILPVTVCHYLDSAKKCLCGTACLEAFLHYIASLNLHKISATVTAIDQRGSTSAPIELFLCSAKCLKLWKHHH